MLTATNSKHASPSGETSPEVPSHPIAQGQVTSDDKNRLSGLIDKPGHRRLEHFLRICLPCIPDAKETILEAIEPNHEDFPSLAALLDKSETASAGRASDDGTNYLTLSLISDFIQNDQWPDNEAWELLPSEVAEKISSFSHWWEERGFTVDQGRQELKVCGLLTGIEAVLVDKARNRLLLTLFDQSSSGLVEVVRLSAAAKVWGDLYGPPSGAVVLTQDGQTLLSAEVLTKGEAVVTQVLMTAILG